MYAKDWKGVGALITPAKMPVIALSDPETTGAWKCVSLFPPSGTTVEELITDLLNTGPVLLDQQGNFISTQIGAEPAKDAIDEGKVHHLKHTLVTPSRPAFRPVEAPHMIQITTH